MTVQILFVIDNLKTGGAQQHFTKLAIELRKRGWRPEFFVIFSGGRFEKTLMRERVPVHCPRIPKIIKDHFPRWGTRVIGSLLGLFTLVRLMASQRPKILHFCLPGSYVLGGIASILTGVRPRVMSRRSLNHYQDTRFFLRYLEKMLHKRIDLLSGNSKAVLENLIDEEVPKEKLRLIYNGVDLSGFSITDFSRDIHGEFSIPTDATILIIVANLFPYKGHLDLLQALDQIKFDLPDPWRCLCVGDDRGHGPDLSMESDRLGLSENVLWIGERTDIPDLLATADISILCSHEEGFSNSILEAMAAGLPMVVTDVGGNAEAVVNGETGIVTPPRNSSALASAILRLANNRDLRIKMGVAARVRAHEFSFSSSVNFYEKMYQELL